MPSLACFHPWMAFFDRFLDFSGGLRSRLDGAHHARLFGLLWWILAVSHDCFRLVVSRGRDPAFAAAHYGFVRYGICLNGGVCLWRRPDQQGGGHHGGRPGLDYGWHEADALPQLSSCLRGG